MKKTISILGAFALAFAIVGFTPSDALALTPLSQINSGDLLRGESFNAVYYYGADGFRYVFPNDKTYFTWYQNFDSVKWVSDADLAKIQIGGNVTYKPGVRMIKINSDPKTYAVGENGTLSWVSTEAVAIALYGSNWSKMIDDVPDAFFSNYHKNGNIDDASDFNPANQTASATSINHDKDLQAPILIMIKDDGYSPSEIEVTAGRAVRFQNSGSGKHTATANNLEWGTGTLNAGETFSRYFKEVGSYSYFDSYNPDTLQGIITVK